MGSSNNALPYFDGNLNFKNGIYFDFMKEYMYDLK